YQKWKRKRLYFLDNHKRSVEYSGAPACSEYRRGGISMRSIFPITHSLGVVSAFFLLSVALSPTPASAQQAATTAQSQATATSPVNLTAKSANIGESGIPIKLSILRWS